MTAIEPLSPQDQFWAPQPPVHPIVGDRGLLRFVDLFAGIGGFHAALAFDPDLAGRCVFASEIDEACRRVYEQNFSFYPDGDIWPITDGLPQSVPDHDVLCAGFPCQDFSKSGRQDGVGAERGTLFFAIIRVIAAKKPPFVLLENVRNLAGPRHRETWDRIISMLRDEGYAVSDYPTVLSPHHLPPPYGSPQTRERLFIPAVYVGRKAANSVRSRILGPLIDRTPFAWKADDWRVLDYLAAQSHEDGMLPKGRVRAIDAWSDFVGRVTGPLPRFPIWTDVALGQLVENAAHPPWKNSIIRANQTFLESQGDRFGRWMRAWDVGNMHPSYRKLEWQAPDTQRDLWLHSIQFRPSGLRVRPLTYLPALVAMGQAPILGPLRRAITPAEAAQLQGFDHRFLPADFRSDLDDVQAFKQLGNAVHVGVVRLLARALWFGEVPAGVRPLHPDWLAVINSARGLVRSMSGAEYAPGA
jgi:DNA (cytosine-5)-methyltransferase 1